jgi:sulfatase maturation enzyme AslB (radical SAM superfamily)
LLAKPSGNSIGTTEPAKLIAFVQRAHEQLGPIDTLTIVGGEPFLHADAMREYLDAGIPVATTTNGVFDFEEMRGIIGRVSQLTFSIDGPPEIHNRTRKSLMIGLDPFVTTYHNLRRTVEVFPDLDVLVQGAVVDEEGVGPEEILRYYALMLSAGVKREKILLGPCAATVNRGPTDAYKNTIATYTRESPCCDHTLHKGFVVYNGLIYGSYYRFEECSPLGTLDDPVDEIVLKKKEEILRTMPMLHDEVCMNECRAVGVCWGLCTSARHVFEGGMPSSVCDRASKESRVLRLAEHRGEAVRQHQCTP